MPHLHAHSHSHGGHSHHPDHVHGHVSAASAAALRTAFFINLAFTRVAFVVGWWTGSIAVNRGAKPGLMDALDRL